jgi:hypothetical protein
MVAKRGFWVVILLFFVASGRGVDAQDCCVGIVGDANGSGDVLPTIGDITTIIDVLFVSGDWSKIPCLVEADINVSGNGCTTPEDITIGDISCLIDYLFNLGLPCGWPGCQPPCDAMSDCPMCIGAEEGDAPETELTHN